MFRPIYHAFFAFILLVGAHSAANAERRTAFLVGNGAYAHAGNLKNPSADVNLLGEVLNGLDFEVDLHENLTRVEIGQKLSEFLAKNDGADVTFVYLAGHGMQYEGRNYFLGTDARLATEFDIPAETTPIDAMIKAIQTKSRASLVFIDACRDNPLATAFYKNNFSESRGLADARSCAPDPSGARGHGSVFSLARAGGL